MSPKPLRLLQFTDLHLYGDAGGELRGVATLPSLEATLATARKRQDGCDAVLLTGDLVQDDPSGYKRVRALFGESTVPIYCIPGNHDVPQALESSLGTRPFQVGGSAVHGEWLIVLLSSYLAGKAGGRLEPTELARLDSLLAAHPSHHALVCLHHHPVPMASRWLDTVSLENPAALFEVLDKHRNVRAMLWGHVHQAWEGTRNGVRLMCTPSTCAQFKPGSDNFAIDRRPPGYRWLNLHADGRIDSAVEWVDSVAAAPAQSRAG